MPIYHCSVKIISRGSGRSAVGAAAYRAGNKLHNKEMGITHDYTNRSGAVGASAYRSGENLHDGKTMFDFTRKKGIVYSEIMLPKHAPRAYQDRETLWNAVEKIEKQINARTAREVEIALPNELNEEQQIKLVQDYVRENFVNEGMCADFAIHAGKHEHRNSEGMENDDIIKKDNPHAHIMLTVRPLNDDGSWGAKSKKEYILDKNGNRIKLKSGEWKSRKINSVNWDNRETLLKWRENWALTVNREFKRLGITERIDHRTLKAQGIDREPTIHIGVAAKHMELAGRKSDRMKEYREVIARNEARNPEITAEYMYEIKQGYYILDKEISLVNEQVSDTRLEIQSLRFKEEKIKEDAEHIHVMREKLDELRTQRNDMGFFKSKKEIDEQIALIEKSRQQAEKHFKQNYYILPEQAVVEIKRLEYKRKDLEQIQERFKDKLMPLEVDKRAFLLEYQKQKLLAEISPRGQKIKYKLAQLDKEDQLSKKSVQDRLAQIKSERNIDTITKENLLEIRKELSREQAEALVKLHRERDKKREHVRVR